jgi:hypothetical protein
METAFAAELRTRPQRVPRCWNRILFVIRMYCAYFLQIKLSLKMRSFLPFLSKASSKRTIRLFIQGVAESPPLRLSPWQDERRWGVSRVGSPALNETAKIQFS